VALKAAEIDLHLPILLAQLGSSFSGRRNKQHINFLFSFLLTFLLTISLLLSFSTAWQATELDNNPIAFIR